MINHKSDFDRFQLEVEVWKDFFEKELGCKFEEPHTLPEMFEYITGEKLL